MTNLPRDGGAPQGRSVSRSRNTTALLWFAAVVAAAAGVVLLLTLTGTTTAENAVTIVAWILIPVAVAGDLWNRSRKRRRAGGNPVSLEDARRRINADEVRSVRESKGEVNAVKEVRRQEPGLSFADALELVRGL